MRETMRLTASKLRENLYRLLDQVIATGTPIEVTHKGTSLKIIPEKLPSKLGRLPKRKSFKGDPDDILHMDWLAEGRKIK